MAESYRDRPGDDPETGAAIQVRDQRREVILAMGVMRNFGSLSEDAWAAMTPAEARELARDLEFAAHTAEARHG